MPFDLTKFEQAQFQPREVDVDVPDLATFFDEGEKPVWRVRGLTGAELARANEAAENNRKIMAMLDGLLSENRQKVSEAVREFTGRGETQPDELVKRIEMLVMGSVAPAVTNPQAARLARTHPVVFWQITNQITELTGQGQQLGKPPASTGEKTSSSP